MPPAPKLIARAVRQYEIEGHFHVMCEAFGLSPESAREIYFADPFFDLTHKRILFDGSSAEPVAGLTIIPTAIRLAGGATMPVAGLAGVGTVPGRRNQGLASALLNATLRDLAGELHYGMSALVTDRPDYYRRFGWETCSTVVHWQASPSCLPKHETGIAVQLLTLDQYQSIATEIHALYEVAGAETPGTFVRDTRRWRCIETLSPGRQVAVWQPRGRVEGYVAFDITTDGDATILDVHELITTSHAGGRALLAFLANQTQAEKIRGRMNAATVRILGLDKIAGVSQLVEDGVMLRILNLEDCLSAVAQTGFYTSMLAESPEGLTIRIDNAAIPDHTKPVRLFKVTDNVHIQHTAISPADELVGNWIAAPIGAMTQMFVGYRTPTELHNAGELRTSTEEAITLADNLFPRTDPFLAPPDMF